MKASKQKTRKIENLQQIERSKQESTKQKYNSNSLFQDVNQDYISKFTTFTNHNNEKAKQQLKILSKLDYRKQQLSKRNQQSDLFNYCRQKSVQPGPKNIQLKEEQTLQGYRVIDDKAAIFRGKLVYLCDDTDIKSDIARNQDLVQLLKRNNVYLKQYLYGDRTEILEEIRNNKQNNEKQLMNQYFQEYISPQKTGCIETCEWYNQVKDTIFDN